MRPPRLLEQDVDGVSLGNVANCSMARGEDVCNRLLG